MTHFLVRGMSPSLRSRLEEEASSSGESLQEVIRAILCEHYAVDCRVRRGQKREDAWQRSRTVLLKNLDHDLWQAIKDDSEETGESMISLVRGILESAVTLRQNGGTPT